MPKVPKVKMKSGKVVDINLKDVVTHMSDKTLGDKIKKAQMMKKVMMREAEGKSTSVKGLMKESPLIKGIGKYLKRLK